MDQWDEVVDEYKRYLKDILGVTDDNPNPWPSGSMPFRTVEHIKAMFDLIAQIRDNPNFSDLNVCIRRTALVLIPIPKRTGVSVFYETKDYDTCYDLFHNAVPIPDDPDGIGDQLTVTSDELIPALEYYLDRVRSLDIYI
ncbi:MAG: hypothetical protein GYB65_12460 [Chloroflexi bacterium]|nr:hypothetical protein [Chloroflexota bacterium]